MPIPTVAIIGRPNVGKSSLLNALAGTYISVVEPTAGVTRDRISAIIETNGCYFELIDTGGYGVVDTDQLSRQIEYQIHQAIELADVILFMVDIRDGIMPLDEKIAQLLRLQNTPIMGVANKADNANLFAGAGEFSKFGFGDFICISATNNLNKLVLLEKIEDKLSVLPPNRPEQPIMKIAIVGKRNTGKSTFVNAIVGFERVIVSEIPGTTRDAVDVRFERNGKTIIIIDTAGVRKKNKMADSIEFYSYTRATRSIRRADIILFLIDATTPISQVDKKLAKLIADQHKSCILVVNKWDMAKEAANTAQYQEYLTKTLSILDCSPIAFTTATKAKNIHTVLDLAAEIFKQATTKIPTPKLNKALELITAQRAAPTKSAKGKFPKIYYATQIAVNPITILMFVNRPEVFKENYLRFVVGRLQELLPIANVPVRLLARSHKSDG